MYVRPCAEAAAASAVAEALAAKAAAATADLAAATPKRGHGLAHIAFACHVIKFHLTLKKQGLITHVDDVAGRGPGKYSSPCHCSHSACHLTQYIRVQSVPMM